jgi:hypothetical protein
MKPYTYELGPEPLAACGAMRPFGSRILCRAILDTDWLELRKRAEAEAARAAGNEDLALGIEATIMPVVTFNSTDAAAFVIVAVGGGVAKWCEGAGEVAPLVGQHCDVRSVAADRVYAKDVTGRYWLVPVEDVGSVWDAPTSETPGLVEAINAMVRRKQESEVPSMGAASNGEAHLEAVG